VANSRVVAGGSEQLPFSNCTRRHRGTRAVEFFQLLVDEFRISSPNGLCA
jgi:hypothetical protein